MLCWMGYIMRHPSLAIILFDVLRGLVKKSDVYKVIIQFVGIWGCSGANTECITVAQASNGWMSLFLFCALII